MEIHVVLHQPQIPPNTGNVMRLCRNTGAALHLIEPLGFELDDKRLRRAGLDYADWRDVITHASYPDFVEAVNPGRVLAFSRHASSRHDRVVFNAGDVLLFGSETQGLPDEIVQTVAPEHRLRIPMRPDNRSLNLSNAVAVAVYEAWRQHEYEGSQ